jgi:hypothetical protein
MAGRLTPNRAFNRTRRYGPSTWRASVAAGRLAWFVGGPPVRLALIRLPSKAAVVYRHLRLTHADRLAPVQQPKRAVCMRQCLGVSAPVGSLAPGKKATGLKKPGSVQNASAHAS